MSARDFDSKVVVTAFHAAAAGATRRDCPNEEGYRRKGGGACHDPASGWTCPYLPSDPERVLEDAEERHYGLTMVTVEPRGSKHVHEECLGWCWCVAAEERLRKRGFAVMKGEDIDAQVPGRP